MLKILKKNRLSALLQIIQLTTVFIVLMFIVSSIIYRINYYAPIKDSLNRNGLCVDVSTAQNLRAESEIRDKFPQATQIWGVLGTNMFLGNTEMDTIIYDSETLSKLYIKLDSGNVSKLQDNSKNYCLISNGLGHDVGDEIEVTSEDKKATLVVAGVISDNQQIMGFTQEQISYKNDYRDFYLSYNSDACVPIVIASENTMKKLGFNGIYTENVIINFPKENFDENTIIQKLSDEWAICHGSCDEFKELSENYISEQLYVILPIIICVLLLTIFTSISSNAINAKRNLRNYGILYLCGATWKKCMRISVVNSCFVSLISLFLSLIVLLIGKITFWHDTVITLGFWQISACLAALFIHVTISMFIPLLMIGRTQPRDVLKR